MIAALNSNSRDNASHDDFQYTESNNGKTGVDFRYCPYQEFNSLSVDQQQKELLIWQRGNNCNLRGGGKKVDGHSNKKSKFLESKISVLESNMEMMSKYMEQQSPLPTAPRVAAVNQSDKAPSGNKGILKVPTYNLGNAAVEYS